jgi:lipoprotein-anchoring transpeptidase ErfK/SrfK
MRRIVSWLAFFAILGTIGLLVGVSGVAIASRGYSQQYVGRIYPGVRVYGVDLGGLTREEALSELQASFPEAEQMPLTLRERDRTWLRTWADLGLHFDMAATARLAYQVGREGPPPEQFLHQLRARSVGWEISPVVVLPNLAQAKTALEALAPEVLVPPVNASLHITAEGISPTPAQAGRALDVAETLALLPHAVHPGPEGLVMELMTRQLEPAIGNPGPVQARAEALLAQPFSLTAFDPLTQFETTLQVEPATVAEWLSTRAVEDEQGARLVLTIEEEPLRAYLNSIAPLSPEVAIDVERTLPRVRAAIEADETTASVVVRHPEQPYVVQLGDTLTSIARDHGFPVWRLAEANPDVEPGTLRAGQQIVIPSVDVLFPLPLDTHRRIVVDLSEQRLRAYEGQTLVYDYIASTGIKSSPTIPGRFQVLSKEEEAYASNWDLWMPHFIGIYRTGPDFINGIHGLPTLSGGSRLWEGHLGRPVSFGCIVLGLEEAAQLYQWTELGILVLIQE